MQIFWDIIVPSSFTSLILYIWLETNAFVEYISAIDFMFSLATKERNESILKYRESQKFSPSLSYPEFLLSEYDNFFTRLLSCPVCLSVWVTLIVMIVGSYSLVLFPASVVASLFMYFKLCKTINGE
jgi:hypothetical protein